MKKLTTYFFLAVGVIAWISGLVSSAETRHRTVNFPLPGHSGANALLQKDTLFSVITAAGSTNPQCKPKSWDDIYVADTRITQFPKQAGKSPWKESWTVNVCGKPVVIPVTFIPDPDPRQGTTFSISVPKHKTH